MATAVQNKFDSRFSESPAFDEPVIRPICEADIEAAARAAFAAHSELAARNGHPSEHPNLAFSTGLVKVKVKDPNSRGFVAEQRGRILGSVFLNFFPSASIAAVGPLTVDPSAEGSGAGRLLLASALDLANECGVPHVRLVQSPAHLRSLVLYSKLGFAAREPLVLMHGSAAAPVGDRSVRKANADDISPCERLCERIHGFIRRDEISGAVEQGTATVVVHDGKITGYATGIGLRGHAVGETTEDIKALIAAAPAILGPGFFVPIRNTGLLRWLLANGYRAMWQATLMSSGSYQDPAGAFLPSIAY